MNCHRTSFFYPDRKGFHLFNLRLPILLAAAALLYLLFPVHAHAQTRAQASGQTAQQAATLKYAGTVLSDFTERTGLKDRYYVIEDHGNTLTRQQVENIIRSGKLTPYLSTKNHYNMGYRGTTAWMIFPFSSISSYDNWRLSFGNQFSGRYTTLKAFSLYDMNTGKYLYNTDTLNNPTKTVPETLRITAHPKTTTFLIVYVRSAPSVLTIISPELVNPRLETPLDTWTDWIVTAISLAGFISMIAIYKSTRNLSYLFISVIWLATFGRHLFVTKYLFTSLTQTDILIPLTWAVTPFMIIGALWTSPGARDDLPPSLIIGATCLFMISSITGLILMHPMPNLATFLLYGPIGLACALAAFSTWPFIFAGRRIALLCLATMTLFLGGMVFWMILISFEIINLNKWNLMIGEALLCLSILSSVLFSSTRRESGTTLNNLIVKNDSFDDDQIDLNSAPLKEAKEISEHKRLIQVLERERKNMADMQLQAARQTEEMRRSKDAADEANRAKSAFLAIVSHEIRTPMTGIMGMIRLLQDTQITKEQREYVSTIKDSGDAMLALLNDILDYEKIESGKMELEVLNCDIRRLARTIHTLMSGHAASKNVDLILELDPAVPTWIRCDPTRLRQVLLNLLNNAIKFTNKGNVYLRIRSLTSEELSKQGIYQLYFAVQDSGIGISPEQQKKLFMPFAQANTSISRKYGGTGLGLAICKRLIETMGGGISISSKEGEGSTFFFTLDLPAGEEGKDEGDTPDSHQNAHTSSNATSQISLNKNLQVLIVDDNGINQKVVAGFVSKLGASYETAGSGQDALEALAKNKFDVIFLDIELPDMNGMEVTNRIRNLNLPNKAGIPIVALTGNVADSDLTAYRHVGMNDFAAKPITLEALADMLIKADGQKPFAWNTELIYRPAPLQEESSFPSKEETGDVAASLPSDDLKISGDDNGFETVSETALPLTSHLHAPDNPVSLDPSADAEDPHMIDTNLDFLKDGFNLDLDEDEDSFEMAVRKFEEQPQASLLPSDDIDPKSLSAFGLDETMLTSLTGGLPADTMHEILISFYEKTDELIASIGAAYVNGNAQELRARAHELKGMAGNFGFKELSQLCAHIESSAKNEDIQAAKDATGLLGERYSVARGKLTQWLAEK
ncbi:MAG: ATP-binding protein [Pseudobdellovibrionaceae bacterium]|jgi:signal transduction histidine kinase/DNA-binding NarL/FixJ family response regulator/HPt (histidine-containing phosphotransfer) domain-containing protein|nr:ATP-binding protein [Pseudobdellovibrionaceae bacterium]